MQSDGDDPHTTQQAVRPVARAYLRNTDAAYLVFAALMMGAWLFADLGRDFGWAWFLGNAVVVTLFAALSQPGARRQPLRMATLQRAVISCVVLPFNYFQSGPLIEQVRVEAIPGVEATLARWDLQLLGAGYHDWVVGLRVPAVTEILQILYACFYFLPVGLVAILVLRRKAWALPAVTFGVASAFLGSYVGYLLVPGRSPAFLDDALVHDGGIWIATAVWNHVREAGSRSYDVFPSGHTALSLLVVYYAWRFDRVAAALLTVPAVSIVLSTIYFQYHYVVDVPAGMLLTLAVILWDRAIRRRSPARPTLQTSWVSP